MLHISGILFILIVSILIPFVEAYSLISLPEGGTVAITDRQTGIQYQAYIAQTWITTPGACSDTDQGFNPGVQGTVTLVQHHPQYLMQIQEGTYPGYMYEVSCGKDIQIEGVNTPTLKKLAVAFWYPIA